MLWGHFEDNFRKEIISLHIILMYRVLCVLCTLRLNHLAFHGENFSTRLVCEIIYIRKRDEWYKDIQFDPHGIENKLL